MLDSVLRLSLDTINEKGLQIHPRRSQRHSAKYLTDLDFADDIALTSDLVENAESFEKAATESLVGLYCNESKPEFISTTPSCHLRSLAGAMITQVDDFKFIGSYIMDSKKDVKSRKALAWAACKYAQQDMAFKPCTWTGNLSV